jgi:hypothetical protein
MVAMVGVQLLTPVVTRWGTAVLRATVTEVRTAAEEAKKVAEGSGRSGPVSERPVRETKP